MSALKTPFVINGRFMVDPATNSITDKMVDKQSRLEPRLMSVLCHLAAAGNKPVTREELIKEIWNNYGGADEGLNQAVSFLRKLLDDTKKEIIETIPKKGYVLHAVINNEFDKQQTAAKIPTMVKINRKVIYVLGVLLALILLFLVYKFNKVESPDVLPANGSKAGAGRLKDTSVGADVMPADTMDTGSGKKTSKDAVGADVPRKQE